MSLTRKDYHPDHVFMDIPYPAPGLFDGLDADADGDARTGHAWSGAHRFAEMLARRFPTPPEGAIWGCDVMEREFFYGEWPEGDYECYAYVTVGVLFRPDDAEARAFAERVRAEAPTTWDEA